MRENCNNNSVLDSMVCMNDNAIEQNPLVGIIRKPVAAFNPEPKQPLAAARNKEVSKNVFDVYYIRIFSTGYELQRQGSARANEYFDRKGVP